MFRENGATLRNEPQEWRDCSDYLIDLNLVEHPKLFEQRNAIWQNLPQYGQVFKRLAESNGLDAREVSGVRGPRRSETSDSYPRHGMRVARNTVERLGVVDESTFLIALFHDYGSKTTNTDSQKYIRHNIKSFVKNETIAQEVLDGIKLFATIDEKNMVVTQRIFSELEAEFPFGQEFSPEQIASLKKRILDTYTNKPGIISEDKYNSIYDSLSEVSNEQRLSKTEIAAHVAYLAACIDNIDHPKPGRNLADLQKIALSLQQYLPIYWSISDHFAHEAETVINKAFHPQAYANLEAVWEEDTQTEVVSSLENQKRIYEQFLKSFQNQIVLRKKDTVFVSEETMKEREKEFREADLTIIDTRRKKILADNEVYLSQLDAKSKAATFRKAVRHWNNPGEGRRLRPDIVEAGFGTPEFWKKYTEGSYDKLRARLIMGAQAFIDLNPFIEEINSWDVHVEGNTGVTVAPEEMEAVWDMKQNNARSIFDLRDRKHAQDEFYEIKTFANKELDIVEVEEENGAKRRIDTTDQRYWFYHTVLRLPVEGVNSNFELHAGLGEAYVKGYVGPSDLLHINYKVYEEISAMMDATKNSAAAKKEYMRKIAAMSNRMKNSFLNMFDPVDPKVLPGANLR